MSGLSRPVVGDPAWRLLEQDGRLVATAGSDEVWVVDDAPGTVLTELAACWGPTPPLPDQLSPQARLAVEQLRSVGALGPRVELPAEAQVATVALGAPEPGWDAALEAALRETGWRTTEPGAGGAGSGEPGAVGGPGTTDEPGPTDEPGAAGGADAADVLVAVRTTARWAQVAEAAAAWVRTGRLHLVVDLAAAHTVAVGPFCVPGHTACAGCLAARVMARWGDPEPPARPGATRPAGLSVAAGLVASQLEQATRGDFPLVDRTAAVDLRTASSTTSPCLRTPRCPCSELVTDGRVELPW